MAAVPAAHTCPAAAAAAAAAAGACCGAPLLKVELRSLVNKQGLLCMAAALMNAHA
jgi:hypothetical protein